MNTIHLSILGSAPFSNVLSELEFNDILNQNNNIKEANILLINISKPKEFNKNIIFNEIIQLKDKNYILYLHSIILFDGMDNAGHYTCLINCNESWYLYDDSKKGKKLEKIGNFNDISTNQLYISKIYGLVYVKIDNLNGGKSSIKLLKKY